MNKVRQRKSASLAPVKNSSTSRSMISHWAAFVSCASSTRMIDLTVKLVADPFAHAGRTEQPSGPVDEVVEVGHTSATLGTCVGGGECLSRPQPRRHVPRQPRSGLDRKELTDAFGQRIGMRLVIWVQLDLPRPRLPA